MTQLQSQRILLVDDAPENLSVISSYLERQNFIVLVAEDGFTALEIALRETIDLILLDILMPEMDGFETCQRLKSEPQCRDIPVIFMTSLSGVQHKIKAFHIGGVDYLLKPVQPEELWARINLHLRLRTLQKDLAEKNRQLNTNNRQLHYSLQQQKILFDNSLVGIAFLNGNRQIVQVNDECARIFGYSKEALIGQSVAQIYPNLDQFEYLSAQIYPLLNDGKTFESEQRMVRQNGELFWCYLRGKAIDPTDVSQGSVWNIEDIEQRKVAEDDLRLAATVFNSLGEALLVCDPSTHVIRINPAFTELTGYTEADILGQTPNILSSGLHSRAFFQTLWDELLQQGEWQGEIWNRRKDGSVLPMQNHITLVRRPDGAISHYVSVISDISERKRTEQELTYQAHYDKLTRLPNRSLLHDRLLNALARAKRHGQQVAVLYIDLDGFKAINDTFSHDAGDQVLIKVAKRLQEALREEDTAARLGGDEFIVLLADLEYAEQADVVAKRLIDRLALTIKQNAHQLSVSASIGIAVFPHDADAAESLLRQADTAMYRAKQLGKNTYCRAQHNDLKTLGLHNQSWRKHEAEWGTLAIDNAQTEQQRLLYVEDNPVDALLVEALLAQEGYLVDHVATGAEGIQRLHDGRYAMALIDYQLPDMNGMDLLEYALREHLPIPLVMVTAQEDVGVAVEAMKRGAMDYVRKDAELDGLLPAIVARTLTGSRMRQLQREATQALEEKTLYRSIFDTAFLALVIMDNDGRIVDANQSACTLFGYTHEAFTKLYGQVLFHQEDYGLFKRFLNETEEFPRCEITPVSRKGKSIYIEIQRSRLTYHGVAHWLALIRDISAHKQAEMHLRQAAIVFEHATEGIFITNAKCKILAVNEAFVGITQYQEVEVIGHAPEFFQSGRHDQAFYRNLWQLVDSEGFWQGEIWQRRKNGALFAAWQGLSRILDGQGRTQGYIGIFSDITDRKLDAEKIQHLLHYDALTHLPNRVLLRERLEYALQQAAHHQSILVVLHLGLDRFKSINESLGPLAGDELLRASALRLQKELPANAYLGRVAGDEFACFMELKPVAFTQQATALAMQVLSIFTRPFSIQEQVLRLSASLGVSLHPRDGSDATTLLKHASTAMSRAKRQGPNTYQFYAEELTALAQDRLELENALRQAMDSLNPMQLNPNLCLALEGFYLCYQPQVDLKSGRIFAAEALLRWQHPQLGMIPPSKFIPIAEENALILILDRWVLCQACQQMRQWLDAGLPLSYIAVNVSALQLRRGDVLGMVEQALKRSGLPPQVLELEITEGVFIGELERASTVFTELRDMGVRLAIDDFGTGYSSLSYLEHLHVDKLKLDRSLLEGVGSNPDKGKVAAAAIALGCALQLKVLCEGIENEMQESFLKTSECHEGQGYLYSQPLPASEFEQFVINRAKAAEAKQTSS